MMRLITKILTTMVLSMTVLRAEPVALDTDALATLAVQDHGRKKPFTTFAQETLLTMSGTSALPFKNDDGTEIKLSPEEVVLDLWLKPEGWDDKPVIMLNFLALKKQFGLPEDQKLFSFNELIKQPSLGQLLDDAQKLRQAGKGDNLIAIQKEAEHLGERLRMFQDLVNGQKPLDAARQRTQRRLYTICRGRSLPAGRATYDGRDRYIYAGKHTVQRLVSCLRRGRHRPI
jgi:hypothetical protein